MTAPGGATGAVRVVLATTAEAEPALRRALLRDGQLTVVAGRVSATARPLPFGGDVLVVDLAALTEAGHRLILSIMDSAPLPIVALCRDDEAGDAGRALAAGAVDAVSVAAALANDGALLRRRVALVSGVRVVRRAASIAASRHAARHGVVAIAASTGGPAALAAVLPTLGGLSATVLLVQHLHGDFMEGFVAWLDHVSALPVTEAQPGEKPRGAHVYVAPAGQHLRLDTAGKLSLGEHPTALHRPSGDELLGSVASTAGASGVGVVLTGMGRDGATGLLAMRRAGARTFVQDEASCVVFGMPRAALELGAVDDTTPLADLGPAILTASRGGNA